MDSPLELTGRPERLARATAGRVLIVGARRDSRRLTRSLSREPWAGLPVVGYVDAGHPRYPGRLGGGRHLAVHPQTDPVPVLGGIDRLGEVLDRARATHVVVALTGRRAKRLRKRIAQLQYANVSFHWMGDGTDAAALPTVHSPARGWAWPIPWERLVKRGLDVVGALIGLALLSPLFLVVSIAILINSGWPIFYFQERIGQGGRRFRMIKFRSMKPDAEGETGPIWASEHDSRCTRIGDWLRHTNIDELPQLINVLTGEMTLVGPRPERPVFVEQFRESVPDYDLRHAVPGGMTGWAQVHGWRGRTSLRKRIQYDLDYLQRWSLGLDIRILFMTVQHVLWGKTRWTKKSSSPKP